ncbi:MAG: hypothetical protein AAB964_01195 [Patescibacteria group bacterium]
MKDDNIQKTALKVTRWVGSPRSIVVHTLVFMASFGAAYLGALSFDRMLLILTTIVSLEAIYLAIFIQMSVNAQGAVIQEVEQDIDEIQEDIEDIQVNEEEDEVRDLKEERTLEELRAGLQKLMESVERMQHK